MESALVLKLFRGRPLLTRTYACAWRGAVGSLRWTWRVYRMKSFPLEVTPHRVCIGRSYRFMGSSSAHGSWWCPLASLAVLRGWLISATALDASNADHSFDLNTTNSFLFSIVANRRGC